MESWSLIVSGLLVIVGWGIAYYLNNLQIRKAKHKEIITGYLIEAYRNLEDGMGRYDSLTEDHKRKMENAMADIQLFGTDSQRKLAKELCDECNKNSYIDTRRLLVKLRNNLRLELGLTEASDDIDDIIHWRLK